MTKFHNPLAPKTNRLQAKSAEIKGWVREIMYLPNDTPITIAELACRDEGCPDVETVIGVLKPGSPTETIRVHIPMKDVKKADVVAAASLGIKVNYL